MLGYRTEVLEMETIGERIGSACKDSGLSQKALAEKLDWDQARLSRVISGSRKVSAGEIAEIATILDVSLDWLITGSDPYWVPKDVAARHEWDGETKNTGITRRIWMFSVLSPWSISRHMDEHFGRKDPGASLEAAWGEN